MMLGHWPDYTHHTTEDTPDKVDPVELEREEIIAAAAFLYLANLNEAQATELAFYAGGNAAGRLGRAAGRAFEQIRDAEPADLKTAGAEALLILDRQLEVSLQTVESIGWFAAEGRDARDAAQSQLRAQHKALADGLRQQLAARGVKNSKTLPLPFAKDGRIAVRTTRGPIDGAYLNEHVSESDLAWLQSDDNPIRGSKQFELHNFMDGTLTVSDLRNAVSAEFEPIDHGAVQRYVEMLISIDLAKWK